jgi:hypothetical protein
VYMQKLKKACSSLGEAMTLTHAVALVVFETLFTIMFVITTWSHVTTLVAMPILSSAWASMKAWCR